MGADSKIKLFVNNPELWESFLKELDTRIVSCQRSIEQMSEPKDLYRLQGELKALRSLQQLRDKVNG